MNQLVTRPFQEQQRPYVMDNRDEAAAKLLLALLPLSLPKPVPVIAQGAKMK